MLKRKINQYNDGVLKFGRYVEKYDNNEILLDEKEFIQEGKLFFSYKTIREQDRLKFDDTGYKIELKIILKRKSPRKMIGKAYQNSFRVVRPWKEYQWERNRLLAPMKVSVFFSVGTVFAAVGTCAVSGDVSNAGSVGKAVMSMCILSL